MDICSSMFARKKNIPPRNRGRMQQILRCRGIPRCGACATRRCTILIHADLAAVFSGAAVIAARWQEKIPVPETGTGCAENRLVVEDACVSPTHVE